MDYEVSRISYHKAEQSDTGGRFENEIRGLKRIVRYAREGDLVVVDEMLSSTGSQNAEHLTPVILRDLEKSGATVFVVSHVTVDYDSLEDSGWTLCLLRQKSLVVESGQSTPWSRPGLIGESLSNMQSRYIVKLREFEYCC